MIERLDCKCGLQADKGGIVLAIQSELGIPVKVVGVGETADDLIAFDPAEFIAALFCLSRATRSVRALIPRSGRTTRNIGLSDTTAIEVRFATMS